MADKFSQTDRNHDVPTLEQIEMLKSLQGVDSGCFTLAVFSTIEGFFRAKLGDSVDNKTKFYELLDMYRNRFSIHHPNEYMLFRDIDKNQKNTNKVRHRFASLSVEEANSATFLFHQFASIYNLPNLAQINQLTTNLKIWDERMSPSKTASELERANEELRHLTQSNARMSQEVEELESKKADKDNLPETFRLGPLLNFMRIKIRAFRFHR